MYSDFRDQAGEVYGKANGAILSTAVAYEDFSAGLHALRTFQDLFGGDDQKLRFDMRNAWRFDFLRMAEVREAAITETSRADLIIVSIHAARDLPATVKCWVEAALERREGDPGALVLLYDEIRPGGTMPSPAEAFLTKCATRAGMDFFVKHPIVRKAKKPALSFKRAAHTSFRSQATGNGMGLAYSHRGRFSITNWK